MSSKRRAADHNRPNAYKLDQKCRAQNSRHAMSKKRAAPNCACRAAPDPSRFSDRRRRHLERQLRTETRMRRDLHPPLRPEVAAVAAASRRWQPEGGLWSRHDRPDCCWSADPTRYRRPRRHRRARRHGRQEHRVLDPSQTNGSGRRQASRVHPTDPASQTGRRRPRRDRLPRLAAASPPLACSTTRPVLSRSHSRSPSSLRGPTQAQGAQAQGRQAQGVQGAGHPLASASEAVAAAEHSSPLVAGDRDDHRGAVPLAAEGLVGAPTSSSADHCAGGAPIQITASRPYKSLPASHQRPFVSAYSVCSGTH